MRHDLLSYILKTLGFLTFLGLLIPGSLLSQCGVTIPNGEKCEAPGGQNCEFYICVQGNCVPSGLFYPSGTKCGCFTDECFEDFCDGMGNCVCGIFEAGAGVKCASEQNICDGVSQCDGISGEYCNGPVTFPAAGCDDGVLCTVDCNPVEGCVTYPIHQYCDDGDVCSTDFCDTTNTPGCIYFCSGESGCSGSVFCTSFPVKWLNFSAQARRNILKLEWMTALEVNNKGFEVELSQDRISYEAVGFIRGAGTSRDAQFYDFQHRLERYGTHYVRLKQVDIDGKFSYSPTLEVSVSYDEIIEHFIAYPNPMHRKGTLEFSVKEDVPVKIRLYDQKGQEIRTLYEGDARAREIYRISLDAQSISPGAYFCELVGPLDRMVHKLLVY